MTDNTETRADAEFDEYTKAKMVEIVKKFNELEMQYDTRLLATLMAGRAGILYGVLINGGIMSQDDARLTWFNAGTPIENPPDRETKVLHMVDDEIFDPKKTN